MPGGCKPIELSERQETILRIVKDEGPITGEHIAEKLNLTRATLRPDLAILTMSGFLEARPRVGYFYSGKTGNQLLGEHIRKLTVKDRKSVPVVCQEETSVYDAICTMFLEDVGTLFVVKEGGVLVGVVSRKDLLKSSMGNQDLQSIPVGIVMSRMPNIITCSPDDTLLSAASKLISSQVDALPVVKEREGGDDGPEVIGRITKTTVTKAFVELGEGATV
ncbi:MAG: helix-turn-helix transcriptional regulator [Firmicutes bacterium]|uniref:CBS domain-containing protein n=1 Tax=Melghirimyces thermohalophilus TaxID=1236220 RepID=A0A1G6P5L6_9BACL|nr:helix-turn-helix transcriptional regulator [Melghirimyces thermohalophilus]MDA8351760.1 helix-turn-helix transcriptional regulator [Bacillota bacterium]SDC74727.1 CBS domain-containing protein [Melghirimyces thermohalophilus]